MAGGIDWFRWHHGSVTDPKFQLVARRSGASLPDVLAVWAYLLETASAAAERGTFADIDCEAWDCLFNFPGTETRTADILKAMQERGLIGEGVVISWEKRQPKREREGDTSTSRVQAHRAMKRHETPSATTERAETPRGEERREETSEAIASGGPPPVDNDPEAQKRELYEAGKSLLAERGMAKSQCGSFITKLAKDHGQDIALEAVRAAVAARPLQATEYLVATCQRLKGERKPTGPPLTVPSDADRKTAEYIAQQSAHAAQAVPPPPAISDLRLKLLSKGIAA